jgi:hypothetical protein
MWQALLGLDPPAGRIPCGTDMLGPAASFEKGSGEGDREGSRIHLSGSPAALP